MWRFLFLIPVYLFSTALPLVFSFGPNLEYEYALTSSWFALIFIPLLGFLLPAKHLPVIEGRYAPPMAMEIVWIFLISPFISFLPGTFLFATNQCECSQNGYLFWMAVQWYPAYILAHAVFHAILRGRVQQLPKKKMALGLILVYLALILYFLAILWFSPQKRLSHFLIGFIHGPIYDAYIAFDGGIMLTRVSHALLACVLLAGVWYRGQTKVIVTGIFLIGAWIGTGLLAGQYPSAVNGFDYLTKLMPEKLAGDGFTLHYRNKSPKRVQDKPNEPKTKVSKGPAVKTMRLFKEAAFHTSELRQILGEKDVPHVHIFVYPTSKAKKLWFGGGATDVADVSTPSIHITNNSWPHRTLRHELVHAMTSGFAYHGLGFHPNMAFTEGVAEVLAPSDRDLSFDEGAAAILASKRLPDVEAIFSPAFWQHSGRRAYTVAGSLIGYIMSKHGFKAVKALYSGLDWTSAVGEPQQDTIRKWEKEVGSKFDEEKLALLSEVLYRYPGVLRDQCPHSKADLKRKRSESVYVRLRQPIGWDPGASYLSWRLSLDSNDMPTRLKVWKRQIKKAALDRFSTSGRLVTWQETLQKARKWPPKNYEDLEMAIIESDLAFLLDDTETSLRILYELRALNKTKNLGDDFTRQVDTRIRISEIVGPGLALEWRKFLAGWRRGIPSVPNEAPWLLRYLKTRNDHKNKISKDLFIASLDLEPDLTLRKTFHEQWYMVLGNKLMRKRAYQAAKVAYSKSVSFAPDARRPFLQEQARRAAYYAANAPTQDKVPPKKKAEELP